jgi:very-short-patch-repair endonuclease
MKNKRLTILARDLRRNQSDAERNLWSRLRHSQLNSVKFRRQQPVGDYIVDFISFKKKFIIEVDGGQHNKPVSTNDDEERTKYLENRGYKVIRFWNHDVLLNLEGVVRKILEMLAEDEF